jgi:ABC-type transport system involved in cytochrome bd biosynthesis fused ATPase/permease subunit
MVYDFLDKNNKLEKTRNIILAAEVFIAFVIIILLYYYLTSRKEDELIELKDAQNLRNFNNYTKDLVTKARELERSKVVKELEKKYEAKELQRENAKKLKLKKSEKSSPTKKEDD